MFVDLGPRLGLGIEQEMILEAQQVHVRQDAALSVQEEGIATFAGLERLHLIGGHGVQQPRAVVPGGANLAAAGQIQPSRIFPQSGIAGRSW